MTTAWSEKSLVEKILDRQGQFEQIREPYNDRFAEIVDFCDPGLTAWHGDTEGEFRLKDVFEGTPPWALRIMADGWLGNLISESLRWFKYLFQDRALRDDDSVNKWLQDLEDHMYFVYRQSELYPALGPYTRAALSVGSPVIIPYESKKDMRTIKCEVPHPKENFHGPGDTYHRKYEITVMDAVNQFMGGNVPDDTQDAKLSSGLLADYKNGNHAKRHWFIRAFYPSDDPILKDAKPEYRRAPWMEFYVEKDAPDVQKKKDPILVQPHWTKPHIRWDYERNSDELYARTPAWHAMMDIRSGQEIAKQTLEAGQLSLHPPMWAQRQYKGRLHRRPKGVTWYDDAEEYKLKPQSLYEQRDYAVGKDVLDGKKSDVGRWFHVDLFRMLSQMPENKGSWPTATHVLEMLSEKAAVLSPRIGRFTGVLRQMDTRFFDIEHRAGRLPEPPDIVLEYMAYKRMMGEGDGNLHLDVEHLGPLAQMQQKGLALGRVRAGLAIIGEFNAAYPNTPLEYKTRPSVAMEKALEEVGYVQDAIVPETEYQEIQAAIAEQRRADRMSEEAGMVADAIPKLSKPIEPGSPLGRMLEPEERGA